MRRLVQPALSLFALSLFALSLFALSLAAAPADASTVIDHANGYTLNARHELVRFTALAIGDDGRVLAVGGESEVAARAPHARHLDAGGRTLLPGLIDAHGHVFELGATLSSLDLSATPTLGAALKAVAAYASANPGRAWLVGGGWNQEIWKLGRFPTAAELDAVSADRLVWLERVDGHAGWVNSRVLALAGITDATPDPAGGRIVRDARGHATGVLVDAAQDLVRSRIPRPTEAEARALLDRALGEMGRVGLTSVHDAGITAAEDALYRDYADHGRLTTRVYAMIGGTEADFDQLSAHGPLPSYAHDLYALRAVKLYADGALGSRGAALLAPYSDEPKVHGLLFHSNAELGAMMDKALAKGYQVNVHAIGDAANAQVLDSFARLLPLRHAGALRNRIEHAQVVRPADIARFRQLGIIPSMQPTHATSDQNMAEARIGHARMEGAYAWRTFLKQGSRIACGSDFPIESPNPFYGIHAAVTRMDRSGHPPGGWYPQQALTLQEAFSCFTLDAAYAAHQEQVLGSLEPGKWADFILVDRDLFKVPADEIHKIRVLQTWVGGRQVWGGR